MNHSPFYYYDHISGFDISFGPTLSPSRWQCNCLDLVLVQGRRTFFYFKWITNIWFIIRFTSPKLNSKSGSRSKISQMKVFLHQNAYKLNLTIEATYICINPFSELRCISHQKSYHMTRSSFDDRSIFLRVLFSIILYVGKFNLIR